MQKGRLWWLSGFTLCTLVGAATALTALVKHEPNFYHLSQTLPGEECKDQSLTCVSHFGQMLADKDGGRENWGCDVSEVPLNCFFQDVFPKLGEAEKLRKLGISSFCVTLEEDRIRLAFRYGSDWLSTVISYDLKIWLVPNEANTIAIEIRSARAGALPISSQSILNRLTEFAREQNYEVNLYRHEAKSVAVLRLQPGQSHPTWILTALKVGHNEERTTVLSIRGRTAEYALAPPLIKATSAEAPK